jgi:transcriptional regulator with XRE-family HTH domain
MRRPTKPLDLRKRGDRLRAFIRARYRSQKIFAEIVGMSQAQVSFYVGENHLPGLEVLLRFQSAGLSIDWYLSGEGEMYFRSPEAGRSQAVGKLLDDIGTMLSSALNTLENYYPSDGRNA